MENKNTTLGEFIIENQNAFQYSSGELSRIINSIRLAAKVVNYKVNKAGLVDIVGAAGEQNIQGEDQQKLDVYANEVFIQTLINREIVCGIGSEENDDFITVAGSDNSHNNKYVVLMDPLDGSSNIDVNVSVGTIFSVFRRITPVGTPVTIEDFLQPGINQVAAGYVIYGSSTILVYSMGHGVNAFTLDQKEGEYILSHEKIQTPTTSTILSISFGYYNFYEKRVIDFCHWCLEEDKATNRPLTQRYIGSMVADIHRNLLKGGIFLYPATTKSPNGKLRLQYECNPLSFIQKQAGGKYTNGISDILEIVPTELHQRVPIALGSSDLVDKYLSFK